MARLAFPVQADGLIVDVVVWLDRAAADDLSAQGLTLPTPVRCRGLLDTGTDISAISTATRTRLGLGRALQMTTTTAAGPMNVDLYKVSLSVTNAAMPGAPLLNFPDLLVMEIATTLPTAEVLIGLDVLLSARLLLDGPGRMFTLDF
jgi:hypothetical protein